ncbi:MAG: hypothetical protein M1816_000360 [Peltula sp. TS41687]|nr:MAG: hypothetical protein M1816_000360 [Peltula sp. TS41687]
MTPNKYLQDASSPTGNEDLLKLVRAMVSGFQDLSVELKQLHLKTSKLEEKVSLLYDKNFESLRNDSSVPHQQEYRNLEQAGLSRESSPKFQTEGPLRCPFAGAGPVKQQPSATSTVSSHHQLHVDDAAMNDNLTASHPPSDPIEAELQGRRPSTGVQSASESAHKCPIRFLSHHSAEEVAQYFERHKHEIPRSHEICVRRHRNNEETIRQLDAKYVNLVSMIQDLGLKHQPLLPGKDDDEPKIGDEITNRSVEEWAGGVNEACRGSSVEEPFDRRGRELHSDHPLKEVRLGESPSRPWGISVVVEEGLSGRKESDAEPPRDQKPAPIDLNEFDRLRPQSTRTVERHSDAGLGNDPPEKARGSVLRSEKHAQLNWEAARILQAPRAQMTFTGPVFIGYQLDDVFKLLKHCTTGP